MAKVDLSDYGYVNARVRGMRAHLLTKEFFMRLVEAENFEALHNLFDQTVYRREINEAVLMNPERPDYDQALSLNLFSSFKKILDSTGGKPHRLVTILLSRYDIQNIKTIMRGKKGGAVPSEIVSMLVPLGSISMDILQEMSGARELRNVLDILAENRIKYARPMLEKFPDFVRRDQDLAVLELALDKFYLKDVIDQLREKDKNVEMVRQIFVGEIDLRNISTIVRIRGLRLEDHEVIDLCIPGGTLSQEQFLELVRIGDVEQIVLAYPDPQYRRVLERALELYQLIDVVAFDRELERELIRIGVGMSNVDVLGVGVIIGYMSAKQNEIINLRILLRGKMIGQSPDEIRETLFFVERPAEQAA